MNKVIGSATLEKFTLRWQSNQPAFGGSLSSLQLCFVSDVLSELVIWLALDPLLLEDRTIAIKEFDGECYITFKRRMSNKQCYIGTTHELGEDKIWYFVNALNDDDKLEALYEGNVNPLLFGDHGKVRSLALTVFNYLNN